MKKIFYFLLITSFSANYQIIFDSLLIDGNYRTFHFVKSGQSNSSLVFVLHGSGGNGRGQSNSAKKLEQIALTENITLVYPDGYKKYWNECRKNAKSEANKLDVNGCQG